MTTDRSRRLDRLAANLEAEGERLIGLAGFDRDYDLGRLTRSLLTWSITLGRMAESGPASLASVHRGFPGHPERGQPDPDPLASHRAYLDIVSFLTAGDMVLDDFAALQLGRWRTPVGEIPWRSFMARLDAGEPELEHLRLTGRYLDLVLREARTRLVAHRSRRHLLASGWHPDGGFELSMVGLDDASTQEAELLAILTEAGRAPGWGGHYGMLVEYVIESAPLLSGPQRTRARNAFRVAGFHLYEPVAIVDVVLRMTSTIVEAELPA